MFSTVVKELNRAMVNIAEDCSSTAFLCGNHPKVGKKIFFVLIVGPVLCVTLLILGLGKRDRSLEFLAGLVYISSSRPAGNT